MKVAVSIPDDVFEEADELAARLKTSRSDVYARALAEYVGNHAPDRVTDAINEVVDAIGGGTDDFSRAAARGVFDRVEW
jgi:metal-responsive CopG/Arc/MetJ family transcriptional regulator